MALESRATNFASGGALQIYLNAPQGPTPVFVPALIDYVSYMFQPLAGSSGAMTFLVLGGDGTWRALANPAPVQIAGAAATYNGVIQGPFLGLQVQATISSGSMTYAEILGTVRP